MQILQFSFFTKLTIAKMNTMAICRSKVKTTGTTSTEELNERKTGKIFEGDVLVVFTNTSLTR